ncbi:MAG: penicillin-binding protein activator [Candidatus Marinimicrobia bacterium]|nr:penicillin-binding protein activator [Candidatus Neomarinimicrobiota bacterium]
MKKGMIVGIFLIAIVVLGYFVLMPKQSENEKEVIKIGAILPLSGDVAVYGKSLQNGMNLALEVFREENPEYKDILIIYEDSKAEPKLAVSAFQKLSSIDNCKIILGGFSSSEVLSMAPIAEKNKVVLISPTASSPSITSAGDYIFRTTPSDNFDGEIMAKFAYYELSLKDVALLYVNNDYGLGISKVFMNKFENYGGKIAIQKSFESDTKDFKTILISIKEKNPDGLYIIATSELGNLLKQKTELGLTTKTFTVGLVENHKVVEVAGKGADSVFYSYPSFQVNSSNNVVKEFVSDYKNKYGNNPDVLGAYGYDLVGITLMALKDNSESSEKIKTALYNIIDYQGVTGKTSFDKNGDVSKTAGIKIILDGKFKWFINNFN